MIHVFERTWVRVIVYEKEMHVGKWVCFQQSWTD